MQPFEPDLTNDPLARRYIKTATVTVSFAPEAGVISTIEGDVPHAAGDAILTGVNGEQWPVARGTFEARYDEVAGQPGTYRKHATPVLARQMSDAFSVSIRNGNAILSGKPGDWLVQYDKNDYGIVSAEIFGKTYSPLNS